jgi:hypothetical protein
MAPSMESCREASRCKATWTAGAGSNWRRYKTTAHPAHRSEQEDNLTPQDCGGEDKKDHCTFRPGGNLQLWMSAQWERILMVLLNKRTQAAHATLVNASAKVLGSVRLA